MSAAQLLAELNVNADRFAADWPKELEASRAKLSVESELVRRSYRRLASLQAWKALVLEKELSAGAVGFFTEAHNDAVLSHVLAVQGLCRSSLQALRSAIENVYMSFYYADHPIEAELWMAGHHRIERTGLESYFESHPRIRDIGTAAAGVLLLGQQYKTLNGAVHGSSVLFRMTTAPPSLQLSSADIVRLKKWEVSARAVLQGINLLCIALYGERLVGTSQLGLKQVVGFALSKPQRAEVKKVFGIVIPDPPPLT